MRWMVREARCCGPGGIHVVDCPARDDCACPTKWKLTLRRDGPSRRSSFVSRCVGHVSGELVNVGSSCIHVARRRPPASTSWSAVFVGYSVKVVIATFRRPDRLRLALASLCTAAERASGGAVVGVVVVDDDPAATAAATVREFADRFVDGCRWIQSGAGNISVARNAGIAAAVDGADWVASIDDDVVVPADWFDVCANALRTGQYDAVTGPLLKDFSNGPKWLSREPFDQIGVLIGRDGETAFACATGNSWISTQFLQDHPNIRFDPELGKTGGEDMDFSYRAIDAGLRPVFASRAAVTEREPPARCTLRYQVRRSFWLGISEAHVSIRCRKATRVRLVARALRRGVNRGAWQLSPADRRRRGARYTLAILAQCVGVVVGACGFTLRHK